MTVSVPRLLAVLSSLCLVTVPVQAQDLECAAVQRSIQISLHSLFISLKVLEESGAALHTPELSEFQDVLQEQTMGRSHLSS